MTTRTAEPPRTSKSRPAGRSAKTVRLVVTNADYGSMCKAFVRGLPARSKSKLEMLTYASWNDVDLGTAHAALDRPTFFVSRVADIPERIPAKARTAKQAKHLLFAEGLPVEALASRLPRLDIRDAQRLHIAREREPQQIANIVYRLVRGITQGDGPRRIVDAWLEDRTLVLLCPAFQRLAVPLDKLEKYIGSQETDFRAFEIDEDGSFLYWPHSDTHLGWEQFAQMTDPTRALAVEQKKQAFNRRYGAAIRAFREQADLKQVDVTGITERNLRRVEHGQLAATKTTLEALAEAHGMDLETYLKELADMVA